MLGHIIIVIASLLGFFILFIVVALAFKQYYLLFVLCLLLDAPGFTFRCLFKADPRNTNPAISHWTDDELTEELTASALKMLEDQGIRPDPKRKRSLWVRTMSYTCRKMEEEYKREKEAEARKRKK